MTLSLSLLFVCIVLSGFFSSAETALFSLSRVKALHLAKEGRYVDTLIIKMKADSHKLLTTILIGNNIVNIGASSLATALAMEYSRSNAVGIATGIMTLVILVFGEIFPKSFAAYNNVLVARTVIYPLFWMSKLFVPLIYILNCIPKVLGTFEKLPAVTEDELMTMVEVVEEEGEIKEEERQLISNIFDFDDTSSSEIMTPRTDMFVIDVNEALDIHFILNSGYTRIPVIDKTIDNVVGVLNVKDLFASYYDNTVSAAPESVKTRDVMKEPFFVPESKKLDILLHEFKRLKNHIGIVIDEYGGVSGLVTLEDVVEEIVGEIVDESDTFDPEIVRLKGKKWIVQGKTGIEDINNILSLNIPESNDYDTFSGYVLDKLGKIPEPGERMTLEKYTVIVKEREGNRIKTFIFKKE
ncbi:MAG: hemolysin family protein [Desulfobacteraceae bacterium]